MKTIYDCIDSAMAQGELSKDEADVLKARYAALEKQIGDKAKSKEQFAKELEAEATQKERVAMLQKEKHVGLEKDLNGWRNIRNEPDLPEALMQMVEADARSGTFMADQKSGEQVILRDLLRQLDEFARHFRRGWLRGDLRRRSKSVRTDMNKVVDALFGEKTDDKMANDFAALVDRVREDLRVRHTEGGGMIGKLDRYGMPMQWDGDALTNYIDMHGIEKLADVIIAELDRERMKNPLTGRVMSDEELREGTLIAIRRIMTDGIIDQEPTGQPQGRGALWKQHADHRFFHFKDGKSWRKIAEQFGNPDPYESIMSHYFVMARDISFMERFGPNALMGFEYAAQLVKKAAVTMPAQRAIYKSYANELKGLAAQLTRPNPEYEKLADQLADASEKIAVLRSKYRPQLGGKPSKRDKVKIDALKKTINDTISALQPYYKGDEPMTLADADIAYRMRDVIDKMGSEITFARAYNAQGYADMMVHRARQVFNMNRGAVVGSPNNFAHVMSTARNVVTATALGSAALSAVSDPAFGKLARMMAGMSRQRSSALGIIVRTMREALPSNRFDAMRLGVGLDNALGMFHQEARYSGLIQGGLLTRPIREGFASGSMDGAAKGLLRAAEHGSAFVADRVIAMQGLNAWTQGGKNLMAKDLMGHFADNSVKSWGDLDELTRATLIRSGFDNVSWDKVRAAVPEDGFWMTAHSVQKVAGRDLAERWARMLVKETRAAVVEATSRTQTLVRGDTVRGTIPGELARSFGQFKGFGVAVLFFAMRPIMQELGVNKARGAYYAMSLVLTSALLGALAMSLKDIKDGRDPRRVLDDKTLLSPEFWGAAIMQGGGMGIYGDFLFADYNRFGGSLETTIAGPVWGRIQNLNKLTLGNLAQLRKGEETQFNAELVKFLKLNTPKVWYTQRFMDAGFDFLQRAADPKASQSWARQQNQRFKNYQGQEYYWPPGEMLPQRPPNLLAPFRTR